MNIADWTITVLSIVAAILVVFTVMAGIIFEVIHIIERCIDDGFDFDEDDMDAPPKIGSDK